ncbi:hypothetical protein NJ7G_1111 [Natrinema sp. J7-2]|nr:hypothetical protein NJ7G_1111 [Natrinema sp. J7-2]
MSESGRRSASEPLETAETGGVSADDPTHCVFNTRACTGH